MEGIGDEVVDRGGCSPEPPPPEEEEEDDEDEEDWEDKEEIVEDEVDEVDEVDDIDDDDNVLSVNANSGGGDRVDTNVELPAEPPPPRLTEAGREDAVEVDEDNATGVGRGSDRGLSGGVVEGYLNLIL